MACRPPLLHASSLTALLVVASFTGAQAQDAVSHRHHRRVHARSVSAAPAPVAFRGLTINRPPESVPGDDADDIYRDGPVRYNDIGDFSPVPYVTSGVEYPYGLDGIGGYGSDLGFGAGQDSALYSRGAGTP